MQIPLLDEAEESAKEYPLLEPGTYDFQVMEAKEAVSKAGNDMITMTLWVWNKNGKKFNVWDRLVATPKAAFRIKNFCKATGLESQYKNGTLTPDDCADTHGTCVIKIDPAQGEYKAKNVVDYYIELDEPPAKKIAKDEDGFDIDCPF